MSRLLSQEEIEKHFELCEFDDECDFCDNPEHGTYAKIDYIPEDVAETDFYICGKCASVRLENYEKEEKEHWEQMGKMADWWAKEQENKIEN